MRIAILISIFALIWVQPVSAATLEQQIAGCSAVKGDLARLQCFDDLSQSMHLNKPQVTSRGSGKLGKWQVSQDKNPIDDSITAIAMLFSDSGKSRYGNPIALLLRCKQGQTEAFINWGSFLGDEADVLTRIGSAPASTSAWSLSSDKEASFYPGDVSDLIKQMLEADTFAAQVTPYNESPITAGFDLHGIKDAVQPIRDTCKW